VKPNTIIRASAGTGKTFSLATRFMRLMAFQKVSPERIVALTFSRAAAQEIYVKLLERLWCAAADEKGAAREKALLLAGLPRAERAVAEAAVGDWSSNAFMRILRRVVDAQHVNSIATLDSFILRIVRSFPLELGFQNAVDVLDEYGEKTALARSCDIVMSNRDAPAALVADFKTAVKGDFKRTFTAAFGGVLAKWRDFVVRHPESATWTKASMCTALGVDADAQKPDLSSVPVSGKRGDPRDGAVKAVETFDPRHPSFPDAKAGELLRYFAAHVGETVFSYATPSGQEKSFDCGAAGAQALRAGFAWMVDAALAAQLETVAAKLRLCAHVEGIYDMSTRRKGLLTFSDFTDCQAANEDADAGLVLQNLQFRFDARFDHWALDEFQDTSELQWTCLRRLVREAAGGDGRTVMVVGDLKQSIYAWRGGDDRPFLEIMRWPEFNGSAGESVRNDISYRYGKRTADFVNAVFGPANVRDGGLFGADCAGAVARWLDDSCWMEHRVGCDAAGRPKADDYVEIVGVAADAGADDEESSETDDSDDAAGSRAMKILAPKICACIQELWRAHEAAKSTETVGILVRNNKDGAYLAECIRSLTDDVPVAWEGLNGVLDAPVVRGVLALLNLAAHPEDRYSWGVVDTLLPIRERVFPGFTHVGGVSRELAKMLSRQGLSRTLREIVAKLVVPEAKLSERSVAGLEALVRAAVGFEAARDGGADVEAFPDYLAAAATRESASSPRVVRILSIHRSKGLTLDHVIVPILECGATEDISSPRKGEMLAGKGWALEVPVRELLAAHPALSAAARELSNDKLIEQLRTYYVALTRARKSTRVFVVDDAHGTAVQFRDILLAPFRGRDAAAVPCAYGTVLFSDGTPPPFGRREAPTASVAPWTHHGVMQTVERRSPSQTGGAHGTASAATLFAADRGAAARRGVDAHAVLSAIEWIDPAAPRNDFERTILASGWREAFVRPGADATVWRERGYERCIGDVWETGQFDRVTFTGTGDSRLATIYDFKTNAKRPDETDDAFSERMRLAYAGQMQDYRAALAALTGMPPERISVVLLLRETMSACPVPSAAFCGIIPRQSC